MKTREKTRGDQLRELLDRYIKVHGNEPVRMEAMFQWARREGLWQPRSTSLFKQFKAEMTQAAREDYYTDPQGREVRKKHAVVIKDGDKQLSLWADIETAPREHMHLSLQQRRRGVLSDVTQLKTDMDSYNDNHNTGEPIQLSFNFDECLTEIGQGSTYSDVSPEDDSSESDEG